MTNRAGRSFFEKHFFIYFNKIVKKTRVGKDWTNRIANNINLYFLKKLNMWEKQLYCKDIDSLFSTTYDTNR